MSIFKSAVGRAAVMEWYDAKLSKIQVQTECRMIQTGVGDTHIIMAGQEDAPPLIILHGMNMNAAAMDSAIAALSQIRRVYAVDIIGMPGKSAEIRLSRKDDGYPNWLLEVMDQLELQQADFLGLSFGGWIILKLAALQPQRISKGVLLDSGGITQFTFWGPMFAGLLAVWYIWFPTEKNLLRAAKPFYAKGCSLDPDFVELLKVGYLHVTLDVRPEGAPPVTKVDLAGLTAPMLVVYGEQDVFFDAQKSVETAKQILPNLAAAEIIPGEGHILSSTAHAQVYNRMKEFLICNNSA